MKTHYSLYTLYWGEDGKSQQFLVWATCSSFSLLNNLEILVLPIKFLYIEKRKIYVTRFLKMFLSSRIGHLKYIIIEGGSVKKIRMWLGRKIVMEAFLPSSNNKCNSKSRKYFDWIQFTVHTVCSRIYQIRYSNAINLISNNILIQKML